MSMALHVRFCCLWWLAMDPKCVTQVEIKNKRTSGSGRKARLPEHSARYQLKGWMGTIAGMGPLGVAHLDLTLDESASRLH